MLLDVKKLKSIGWRPKMNSAEAVREPIRRCLKAGLYGL